MTCIQKKITVTNHRLMWTLRIFCCLKATFCPLAFSVFSLLFPYENVIEYKITFVVHSFYFLKYCDYYYYYDCYCFSYIRTYLNWHIKCLLKMKMKIQTILHLFFRSISLDDFDRVQCNCNVYETIHTLFTASDSNFSMVPLFLVASNERYTF